MLNDNDDLQVLFYDGSNNVLTFEWCSYKRVTPLRLRSLCEEHGAFYCVCLSKYGKKRFYCEK